jgi:hypothetical protein
MKNIYQATINRHGKSKNRKPSTKRLASSSIAQKYMELRRLRERISEVELGRSQR